MQLLLILGFYYFSSSAAFTLPHVESIQYGKRSVAAPPAPAEGASVDQWLDVLFGPADNSTFNKTQSNITTRSNLYPRSDSIYAGDYRQFNGVHELSWNNESSKTGFNLTMDVSNSCSGLNFSSDIGLYTFSNGTTAPQTQLKDMISDVWSLAPTAADRRRRWANHTAVLAQLALDEAEELLRSALNCQNKTAMEIMVHAASVDPAVSPIHDELRHLLSASAWSYWTATLVSTIIGAALGAGLAAGVQYHFSGNVTHQNVVQTAVVVGTTVLIGGILMRLHENGRLDRLAEAATYQTRMGREAVLQNAHIARWRSAFDDMRRQSMDRLPDGDASRDVAGFSVDGQTSPGSLGGFSNFGGFTPQRTPRKSSDHFMCLDDREAIFALRALGQMASGDIRQRMMEAIYDFQMERLENGEAGPSSGGDWAACQSRDSAGASPLESAEPSFRTAKGGAGEASAADLVMLGNTEYGNGQGGNGRQPNDLVGSAMDNAGYGHADNGNADEGYTGNGQAENGHTENGNTENGGGTGSDSSAGGSSNSADAKGKGKAIGGG